MWQIHPNQTHMHVIDPAVLVDLKARLETAKATVAEPFHVIINSPLFASVQHPINAYARAFEALDHLKREFTAWQDFIEVFRNFHRCLAELSAFVDW
jgi:hypothetical protein